MSDHRTHRPQPAMSEPLIPKEQMSAYQRWELASFDQYGSHSSKGVATQASTQQLRLQARNEGYVQGQADGRQAGQEAGYRSGVQQASDEVSQIHLLLENLQTEIEQMDQHVAQSLLDLALAVANKMVRDTMQAKPEVILDVIREAIATLPQFNQNAHLVLHPQDAELVHKHMSDELAHAGWKILNDAKIERGGCQLKTAHSFIDATNEERWKRVLQSIGQDHPWLA